MVDKRIEKLAQLCVRYSVAVKPKEKVVIRGPAAAAPLMTEIYKECLLTGAYPWMLPSLEVDYLFFKIAKNHQLKFVSPFVKFIYENMDVSIGIFCEPNPKRLTNIDPAVIRTSQASRSELMEIFFKRVSDGSLRWTGLPFPITDQAQEASMALPEYEDFVYSSCLVDKKDPIGEWKKIRVKQEKICSFLNKAKKIHVVGEDTDLTFSVKDRKWVNCSGEKNMPDGEIFTAPVDNSANGKIRFTFPGIYMGREVEDISFTFKNGKIVKASAAKGEDLLKELIKIKGADRIGEAAIGTNYGITRFTKEMLFDEKMGGTVHFAVGEAYPEAGGVNKSAIHWDILKDMKKGGEIYADGELFYKNGKFLA
ncbi:MAG TPA: aminopeptidase [Candidatus Bathyarchaeia archaeon]|nr:aminopeptidase [Candidatus Bathyarchaeia archaeon]